MYDMENGMRRYLLAHLSDLHIKGRDDVDALRALTGSLSNELAKLRHGTERIYLILTGDLVDAPTPEALRVAKNFVQNLERELPLCTPPFLVPGNHDVKKVGGSLFRDNRDAFFNVFPSAKGVWHRTFENDGLELIGLDSNGDAKFARGKLSQMAYDGLVASSNHLAQQIRQQEHNRSAHEVGELRVLALHHHPLPLAEGEGFKELGFIPDEGFMYLQSPATFLSAAISLGCHVILHGHRHVFGLARYSLPRLGNENASWSTIYVLSCPSSTGVNCDAGFNILEFGEVEGPSSFRQELRVFRFIRPRNAGAFQPFDRSRAGNYIPLPVGDDITRDLAVTVYWQISSTENDAPRNEVLWTASSLFRRRAFERIEEADWAEALYIYVATAKAWSAIVKRLSSTGDVEAGNMAYSAILALEDAAAEALNLDGMTFDLLRDLAFDKKAYDAAVPRRMSESSHQAGLHRKKTALCRLREALRNLGVEHWLPGINDA
jgi:hypothetical protein